MIKKIFSAVDSFFLNVKENKKKQATKDIIALGLDNPKFIPAAKKFLRTYKRSHKIELALAICLIKEGKIKEPKRLLLSLNRRFPNHQKILVALSRLLYKVKNYKPCLYYCDQIINNELIDIKQKTGLYLNINSIIVSSLIKLNQMNEARKVALSLTSYRFKHTKHIRKVALILQSSGCTDESLKYWNQILLTDKTNNEALRKIFLIYLARYEVRDAFTQAKNLVRCSDDQILAYSDLFETAIKAGKKNYIKRLIHHFSLQIQKGVLRTETYLDALISNKQHSEASSVIKLYGKTLSHNDLVKYEAHIALSQYNYKKAALLLKGAPEVLKFNDRAITTQVLDFQNTFFSKDPIEDNDFRKSLVNKLLEHSKSNPIFSVTPIPGSVAFIHDNFSIGGGTKQSLTLASNLNKDIHPELKVHFCTFSLNSNQHSSILKTILDNTDVHHVDPRNLPSTPELKHLSNDPLINALTPKITNAARLREFKSLLYTIAVLKPEVIYVRGFRMLEACLAGAIMNVPRVIGHFGNIAEDWSTGKKDTDFQDFLSFILNKLKDRSNITLAGNSQASINSWSNFTGIHKDQFKLIYNILDQQATEITVSNQEIQSLRKEYSIPSDAFIVGTVSRLNWVKDPKLWLRIAAEFNKRCPKAYFIIVGDGIMKQQIEYWAKHYGINHKLIMTGPQKARLPQFYAAMDAFLLTSYTESLPNVVPEAQLHGIPIIAADVGGTGEGFEVGQTGWLCDRNNISEFVNRLQWLYDNPLEKEAIKKKARDIVLERFNSKKIIRTLTGAFHWNDGQNTSDTHS